MPVYSNFMFRDKSFLPHLLRCCSLTLAFMCALAAQTAGNTPEARVLIAGPIDSSRLLTLAANTRSEANAQNDRGKVADSFAMPHMLLQLRRSPEQEQALKNFIDQQHDSSSPNFHQWLTAEQFGQIYGPAPQDIQTVSNWLRSNGFTINTVYPSGMLIDFSGTARQVLAAFWNRNSPAFGKREGPHREYERSSHPGSARAGGGRNCVVARFQAAVHAETARLVSGGL
jgi:hypothetical protein